MKKNKAKKSGKPEKEYKKKRFFAMDDEYEDDDEEYEDDDEEYEDDDEEYEDDDEEYEDDDEEYEDDDDVDEDDDDEDYEDDEDDDEEDEEDIEDDADEEDGKWSSNEARRARRRSRRIRNQILAYLVVILLIAGALGGCFLGGRKVLQKFQENKQEKELEEQLKALQESEEDPVVDLENTEADENQAEDPVLSPLDEIVTARIAEMPVEDKVAALFMVTPEQLTGVPSVTKAGDTTKEALTKYKVGGLVYTDSNITGADQLKELLSNTALIDQTLFLAVQEEGGENSVVASKLSVTEVPDMASVSGLDGAHEAGSNIGAYLGEYGFNLNLAPVADIKILEDSILGNRSFGSDPAQVGEMAASYISGLTEMGVSACVKTFPGLGGVTKATAEGMADTQRSQSDMEAAEFLAYQTAIAAGSEFVMVGTISAPGITGDNTPCCLSSAAVGLLRNNLGFDGIIITGALNETSVTDYYTSTEAAEKAIRAGADMIYMPENFEEAYAGLLQSVQSGALEESRIDESLLRIYRVKYKEKVNGVLGTDSIGMEEAPEEGEEALAE